MCSCSISVYIFGMIFICIKISIVNELQSVTARSCTDVNNYIEREQDLKFNGFNIAESK